MEAEGLEPNSTRSKKVEIIFEQFDVNRDGRLNRSEMAALVVAVNPRVKFSEDQISAILDEVFKTYSSYIDEGKGLSLKGLRQTYDDGAGDVDRDFEALGLSLPDQVETVDHIFTLPTVNQPPEPTDFGGYKFESTHEVMENLKTLISNQQSESKKSDSNSFHVEVSNLRSRLDKVEEEAAYEAHMAMGRFLLKQNFPADARISLDRATAINPNDARAFFLCGNAWYSTRNLPEAKSKYEISLELGKGDPQGHGEVMPQVHVNLGIILEEEGLLINACEHYREAAILNPEHHRALKLLGSAMFGLGEYRLAKEALQSALYLKPNFPDAQCDLGATLQAMGDDAGAKLTYQRALEMNPNHLNALYNLAGLLRDTGKYDEAIVQYAKVLELDPKSWRAQLNQAISYIGAKNFEAARGGLQKVFRMTQRVEVYDMLAQLKRRSRKNKALSSVLANITEDNNNANSAPATPRSSEAGMQISDAFVIAEESKLQYVENCTSPSMLALALEVRAFQKNTRIWLLHASAIQKELKEGKIPENPRNRNVRKAALELILRRLFDYLSIDAFQESIRVLNERILMQIERNLTIDLGKFFALISLLCQGSLEERKRAAFDGLLWRRNAATNLPVQQAEEYLEILHMIYSPGESQSSAIAFSGNKESLSFDDFSELIDRGLPVLSTILKLEDSDRIRHHGHSCGVCSFSIVGLRFRDTHSKLNLCANCYSARKVPIGGEEEDYLFKENSTGGESLSGKLSLFRPRKSFDRRRTP